MLTELLKQEKSFHSLYFYIVFLLYFYCINIVLITENVVSFIHSFIHYYREALWPHG